MGFLLRFGRFQRFDRLLAPDEDWINFVRENNQLAQRQQRHGFDLSVAGVFLIVFSYRCGKAFPLSISWLSGFSGLLIDQQRLLFLSHNLL